MICAERKEERTSEAKALVSLVRYDTAEAVPFVESIFPSEHGARRAGVETADLSTVLRSVENISTKGPRNCRSLHGSPGQVGSPGFPVESCGFGQLHVVLFKENHISGAGGSGEVGNPGTLPRHAGAGGMTKERATVP
jgi:hypothetical protein